MIIPFFLLFQKIVIEYFPKEVKLWLVRIGMLVIAKIV
jgi:hypothetical protein